MLLRQRTAIILCHKIIFFYNNKKCNYLSIKEAIFKNSLHGVSCYARYFINID